MGLLLDSAPFLLGLFSDPEDAGSKFLQSVRLSPSMDRKFSCGSPYSKHVVHKPENKWINEDPSFNLNEPIMEGKILQCKKPAVGYRQE
jgi:hypothetical protein